MKVLINPKSKVLYGGGSSSGSSGGSSSSVSSVMSSIGNKISTMVTGHNPTHPTQTQTTVLGVRG